MSVRSSDECGMSPPMANVTCKAPGKCPHPVYAKGLCEGHYRRQNRDPAADLSSPIREDRGPLADVSTRVSTDAHAALEGLSGGVYAGAAQVLEAWAAGKPLPKRPRLARKAA